MIKKLRCGAIVDVFFTLRPTRSVVHIAFLLPIALHMSNTHTYTQLVYCFFICEHERGAHNQQNVWNFVQPFFFSEQLIRYSQPVRSIKRRHVSARALRSNAPVSVA